MSTPAPQTNGAAVKDQSPSTSQPQASQSQPPSQSQQPSQAPQAQSQAQQNTQNGSGAAAQPAPKPRDARTMELLLTAQGVTAYEARVPQMLLDFAYRHTSSILSDAVHLTGDPHTAGKGGAALAPSGADASVSANAIQLAIASRLSFQFGGGAGGVPAGDSFSSTGGGGPSKEWLMELARERNKVALPRVGAIEWGARLPSERFVLSGVGWGLRDSWAPGAADDEDGDDDDDDEPEGVVNGVNGANGGANGVKANGRGDVAMADSAEDVGGDGVEGGTIDDVFEDDGMMEDEEMEM